MCSEKREPFQAGGERPTPRCHYSCDWWCKRNGSYVAPKRRKQALELSSIHLSHLRVARIVVSEVVPQQRPPRLKNPDDLIGDPSARSLIQDRCENRRSNHESKAAALPWKLDGIAHAKVGTGHARARNGNSGRADIDAVDVGDRDAPGNQVCNPPQR